MRELIHKKIVQNCKAVESWLAQNKEEKYFPIYSSVDIRDSGFKVGSVDANIYPAGFNNICEVDRKNMPQIFKRYLQKATKKDQPQVALLTEEHTGNLFYWENVAALLEILSQIPVIVRVCIPRPFPEPVTVKSSTGKEIQVFSAQRQGSRIQLSDGFVPDVIISNNDFSDSYEWWANGLETLVLPARELGWYQRKKSSHFFHYNRLAKEFSDLIGVDPFYFQIQTELVQHFDAADPDQRESVKKLVDTMLTNLSEKYKSMGIDTQPTVFIKNNSGTYGLGVTQVQSGSEVTDWNSQSRKKMKAAKGGRTVQEIILQEGIPSIVQTEGMTSEPVIYMIGCELAGGFFRAHSEKTPYESLNSPGAVYKRLCMSDLSVSLDGCPYENVYGWAARLSLLAMSNEAQEIGLKAFTNHP